MLFRSRGPTQERKGQGDLTGYLAKTDYNAFGYWNQLARASHEKLRTEVLSAVLTGLDRIGAATLADLVLLDLDRIALYSTYRRRYHKAPAFFAKLLEIYEQGRLPCGWEGEMAMWPVGTLVIY